MKLENLIKESAKKLQEAGIENASLDVKILLERALGKSRNFLISHSDYEVGGEELKEFEALLAQRIVRKPVAQIIGKKEFWGREFEVSEDVLTPRPETEFVVEAATKLFDKDAKINIADLGTGSGCILLSVLTELTSAKGLGVDISKRALAIAEKNAYSLGIERASFKLSNWLDSFDKTELKFDLIISNPPYIPHGELEGLQAELDFEPEGALSGGNDGLDCYRQIADNIRGVNFKYLILEIGINQELQIEEIFEQINLQLKETIKDLAGIKRVLVFENKSPEKK